MRKSIFVSICLALLCFTALAFAKNSLVTTYLLGSDKTAEWTSIENTAQNSANNSENLNNKPNAVEQTVVYNNLQSDNVFFDVLFNTVLSMDKAAAKLKAEGKNGDIWGKYFERRSGLTESQISDLRQIAGEFERELEPVQKRAMKAIIDRRMARANGQQSANPSDELKFLQSKRDDIALKQGNRLRNKLGAERIERIRESLQKNTDSHIPTESDLQELRNRVQRFRTENNPQLRNQSGGQNQ